jgi:glycosyltransferase involved in cell wall biosynthesis
MKLGVIIPLFNREGFIVPAIRSILNQSDAAELDIVVVDDGSTDRGAAVVAEIAARHPAVRLMSQANQGVTAARNAGLAELRPDTTLVTFLDSDDISPAGRIAAELDLFDKRPDLDLTYGLMTLTDRIDDDRLMPAAGSRTVTVRGVSLCAGIFRREWFARLGGFDMAFGAAEDADFLFRLFEQRPRFILSDTVAIYYRRHEGNLTKQKAAIRRDLMLAIHKSVKRRRANPELASLDHIFDMNALLGVKWL